MEILYSKLEKPRLQNILHRSRLNSFFDNVYSKKLTAVIAGAGYGKTTFVSDAFASKDTDVYWYRLDEQDTDFHVFLSYLYAAFSKKEPPKFGLRNVRDLLVGWLSFIEQFISKSSVLILDDFHLIQEDTQIKAAMEFIVDNLPELLHIVVIGRKELPFKLSGLRAKDHLLEINEEELSFTNEEVKLFFTDSQEPTGATIHRILSGTGGWAASLVLLRYAIKKNPQGNVSDILKQKPRYVFEYLNENIFNSQPAYIRNFMMKAALLSEVDTRICNTIFGINDADIILNQMKTDHLMLFPSDDSENIFYLHHLMKDFLITQLNQSFPLDDIKTLHCKIAQAYEDRDVFLSLTHYIRGDQFEKAVRLIEIHEINFLMDGKMNFLGQCISQIPINIIEKHPKLFLIQAKLFSYYGNHRSAQKAISSALNIFRKQGAKNEMVSCFVELGSQYYFMGHVREAKLLMEQVLADVDAQLQPIAYVTTMTFLTFLPLIMGEFEVSSTYYREAMEVIDGYLEYERKASIAMLKTSRTHRLFFKGDFEGSYELSKKLLRSAIELNIEPCLPIVYYQLSADCFFLHEFEKGSRYAKQGIAACEKMALSDSRKGWIYLAWAQNQIGMGELNRAKTLIDESHTLFEDPGNRWGIASAWECQHHLYIAHGKLGMADTVLTNALEIIQGEGLTVTEGILENGKANILLRVKKYDKAINSLLNARLKLKEVQYHLFNNYLLETRVRISLDESDKAIGSFNKALNLSAANDYLRFLLAEKEWLIPFFKIHAADIKCFDKNHENILDQLVEDLGVDPPVLYIYMFGSFKAILGENESFTIPFKSAKSLMILKYLAANRKRGFIPKDELIELLWPDANPDKTGSRFNMAMSALRRALEPNLPPRGVSSYIERKKDSYRLYEDNKIIIDAEQFSHEASQAMKGPLGSPETHEKLLVAEAFYKGAFLQEDRYHDWCIQQSSRYENIYKSLLKAIADSFENKNDIENTIRYSRKIISRDPYDESVFKHLLRLYSLLGDKLKVTSTYLEYEETTKQMDLPINQEMVAYYEKLIRT
ncbi:MAG: transcriptional regulator [Desulfobacterales bacterium]|nr:transcriptional regulator [Desulfobacterales bacterium]